MLRQVFSPLIYWGLVFDEKCDKAVAVPMVTMQNILLINFPSQLPPVTDALLFKKGVAVLHFIVLLSAIRHRTFFGTVS